MNMKPWWLLAGDLNPPPPKKRRAVKVGQTLVVRKKGVQSVAGCDGDERDNVVWSQCIHICMNLAQHFNKRGYKNYMPHGVFCILNMIFNTYCVDEGKLPTISSCHFVVVMWWSPRLSPLRKASRLCVLSLNISCSLTAALFLWDQSFIFVFLSRPWKLCLSSLLWRCCRRWVSLWLSYTDACPAE